MVKENADLFGAFTEDHAFLGKSFNELSEALRDANLDAAGVVARRLDQFAGAHIAFEEENFYPALARLLGENEVKRMRSEHRDGLDVVGHLCDRPPGGVLSDAARRQLLEKSERMETHIAECGELFEAMGRLSPGEQDTLYAHLVEWRLRRPSWRQYAMSAPAEPPSAAIS